MRRVLLTTIVGVALLFFLLGGPLRTVPAGHVGVKDFFGSVSNDALTRGIHLVVPLTRVVKMSVQTQEIKEVRSDREARRQQQHEGRRDRQHENGPANYPRGTVAQP